VIVFSGCPRNPITFQLIANVETKIELYWDSKMAPDLGSRLPELALAR
jgi:hypothetical protein